jgi:hypothetical protein
MNTITLLKVIPLIMLLTLDDYNEARRERYYQFARPTRSCRLKHSQVRPTRCTADDSIIGNLSSCIRIRLRRARRVLRVHQGKKIFQEARERRPRGIIVLKLWWRENQNRRRSRSKETLFDFIFIFLGVDGLGSKSLYLFWDDLMFKTIFYFPSYFVT